MSSNQPEQPQSAANYSLALNNIVNFGRYSFELEQKRGDGIISHAANMLSAISLFSAGGLMAFPIILTQFSAQATALYFAFGLCALLIMVSLILIICAQWRFKSQYMQNASQLKQAIYDKIEDYPSQDQYNIQWIQQFTAMHQSLERINNRRAHLVVASMIIFILSILVVIISALYLCVA